MARQEPSKLEVEVATYLLRHSVPESAKTMVNPLGAHPDPAAVRARHDLFTQKCETCHAYDGGGRTEIGAGNFPRPPVLRTLVPSLSDGEIFYHIRYGIRNTAMPAWNFPDGQVWQLVSYIRSLPVVAGRNRTSPNSRKAVLAAHYVGPKPVRCIRMSMRAGRRPAWPISCGSPVHPDATIPDLSKLIPRSRTSPKTTSPLSMAANSSVTKKSGDTCVPLPAQ